MIRHNGTGGLPVGVLGLGGSQNAATPSKNNRATAFGNHSSARATTGGANVTAVGNKVDKP
jgi:hypothetical protein